MVTRRSLLIGSTAAVISLSGCNALSDSNSTDNSDPSSDSNSDDPNDTANDSGESEPELCSESIEETIELESFNSRKEYTFFVPEGETYSVSCTANGVQSFNITISHDDARIVSQTNQLSFEREHTVGEDVEVTVDLINASEINDITNEIEQQIEFEEQAENTFMIDATGRLELDTDIEEILTLYGPDGRQVTTSTLFSLSSLVYETGEYRIEFEESVSGTVSVLLKELDARRGEVEVSSEYTTVCEESE